MQHSIFYYCEGLFAQRADGNNFGNISIHMDYNCTSNGSRTHKNSKDGILITQLPSETLIFSTKESLGEGFVSKYRNKMPNIKVIEQGNWQTKKIEGYRILLDVTTDGNGNLGLIYIFIFGSNKSTFVFNGLGNKNDPETMNLFENFLSNLTLKE